MVCGTAAAVVAVVAVGGSRTTAEAGCGWAVGLVSGWVACWTACWTAGWGSLGIVGGR